MPTPQDMETDSGHLWDQLANAISMAAKQDQIIWTVFGIFWAANAVLVAGLFAAGTPKRWVGIPVTLLGAITSFVWSLIQKRAIDFMKFYDAVILRLEERLLGDRHCFALSGRLNKDLFQMHVGGMRARPLMITSTLLFLLAWLGALKYFLFFAPSG